MRCRSILNLLVVVLALLPGTVATAQSTTQPIAPTLEQLDRETQALYRHVRGSIVRVKMRAVRSDLLGDPRRLMEKWGPELDPVVKQRLEEHAVPQPAEPRRHFELQPGNLEDWKNIVPPMGFDESALHGIIFDDKGHVLLPAYIDREALRDDNISLEMGDGQSATAKFIGSDRKSNVTVVKLDLPQGTPARLFDEQPAEGSLVMLLGSEDQPGRLAVWENENIADCVVVRMSGEIAGFVRSGHYLSAGQCAPIVQQIITHGRVKRAALGVLVRELREEERTAYPALKGRKAILIDQIVPNFPAARANMQRGDLILTLAGEPVTDIATFAAAIAAREGDTEIEILRGEETLRLTVKLEQN